MKRTKIFILVSVLALITASTAGCGEIESAGASSDGTILETAENMADSTVDVAAPTAAPTPTAEPVPAEEPQNQEIPAAPEEP